MSSTTTHHRAAPAYSSHTSHATTSVMVDNCWLCSISSSATAAWHAGSHFDDCVKFWKQKLKILKVSTVWIDNRYIYRDSFSVVDEDWISRFDVRRLWWFGMFRVAEMYSKVVLTFFKVVEVICLFWWRIQNSFRPFLCLYMTSLSTSYYYGRPLLNVNTRQPLLLESSSLGTHTRQPTRHRHAQPLPISSSTRVMLGENRSAK